MAIKGDEWLLTEAQLLEPRFDGLKFDMYDIKYVLQAQNANTINFFLTLLDAEIAKIDKDKRFHYQPANVQINAPLALIQVSMEAKMGLLKELRQALVD